MIITPKYTLEPAACLPEKPQFPGSDTAISGFRYYNPNSGRWLSKDPIEEAGGVGLYVNVRNDLINRFDFLGMFDPYPSEQYKNKCEYWKKVYDDALKQYPTNLQNYLKAAAQEQAIIQAFKKYPSGANDNMNPGSPSFDVGTQLYGLTEDLISVYVKNGSDLDAVNGVLGKLNASFKVINVIAEFNSGGASAGLNKINDEARKMVAKALIKQIEKAAINTGGKVSSGVMAIWAIGELGYTAADLLTLKEKLVSEPQGLMQQAEQAMKNNLSDALRAKKVWTTLDCFCYGNLD